MDGSTTVVFTLKVGELVYARKSRPFGGRVPTQESSQQSRTLSLPTHIILGAAKHSATRSFRPNSQHATSGSAWIFDAPNPRQVAVRKQLKVSFSSSCAPLPPARAEWMRGARRAPTQVGWERRRHAALQVCRGIERDAKLPSRWKTGMMVEKKYYTLRAEGDGARVWVPAGRPAGLAHSIYFWIFFAHSPQRLLAVVDAKLEFCVIFPMLF